ncbi:MAG: hypothetical protein Q9161_007645 [Pseudevernia consocians]
MASEHDSDVPNDFFKFFTFGPLIVVGLLILLASLLTILDALSWLSNKLREYRARRGTDDALAQNMENGMVENRVENRVVEDGPRRSEGGESNTEELLVRPNAFTEERVWWKLDLESSANLH